MRGCQDALFCDMVQAIFLFYMKGAMKSPFMACLKAE